MQLDPALWRGRNLVRLALLANGAPIFAMADAPLSGRTSLCQDHSTKDLKGVLRNGPIHHCDISRDTTRLTMRKERRVSNMHSIIEISEDAASGSL